MKWPKRLKRDVIYVLAVALVNMLNRLPRRVAIFAGAFFGLAAWSLLPRDRFKSDRHLKLIFGERFKPVQRHSICRTFFINTGKNLVDVVRFRDHFDSEIKPLVTTEGLDHFERALHRGKGVIGVTGHIGNFELLAAWMASEGYKSAVIGRQMYDERLDRLLTENRKRSGLVNFPTSESPRTILRWLQDGHVLGVLIDNDSMRVRGAHLPFFGRLSNTPVGQSILGLRAGAAFVPIACLRTIDNRYRIVVRPEVQVELTGDQEIDIRRITLACSRELESIIIEYPDQWIWLHNRWHTKPPVTA